MLEIKHSDEQGFDWVRSAYNEFDYGTVTQLDSLYNWFFKLIDLQPNSTLLDVACGRSQLVDMATKHGVEAIGLDFAYAPLWILRHEKRGDYVSADAQAMPFPPNSFDYVTSIGSLEHYPDMSAGVRALAHVLKPSGKALIFVPNTFSIFHNIYAGFKTGFPLDDGQPLQRYASRGQWEALLTDNGFRIQAVHKYEMEIPVYWRDFVWYLKNWRRAVYLLLSPLVPINLAYSFAFVCVKIDESTQT